MTSTVEPPAHLDAAAQAEWRRLYPILPDHNAHVLAVLESYCAAYARWRAAEEQLAKTPQLVKNKSGRLQANPWIAISRQNKAAMNELLAELNVVEPSDDWCSLAEARKRLAAAGDDVSQQVLTEYLQQHAEIPRQPGRGRSGMRVDYDALARHRAGNIRVQDHASTRGVQHDADAAELRRRERLAAAELKEFQLSERRGELVARSEVVRALHAAAVALNQLLQRTRFERAEALEGAVGARTKTTVLITQDEAALTAFADALTALSGAGVNDDGDLGADSDAADAAETADDD